ncbi:hypothetical protein PtrSN002B_005778 [Pyrenophora tritici-repentis]|nr:hypothetical protein PtrSN001A_005599 [Pyrenophora tritici-repentis]KAI1542719.1 hypothetical protein PtrSN001C_004104 [Pyrenophora tritici-repentis]KAI1551063.1 hypothetical protein PtrSN002B_005778 [Pyrenophora tritici-repentis]KAI1581558.1 hypothetical protein PtrEW7m1_004401 [Pyrenophora tritici-repentis]KAI1590221.1 hypothetical protein PtrEW13061_005634 [Pyrenophora tritici-repentis]
MSQNGHASEVEVKKGQAGLPTYDCEGAIHVKFSLQRQAINVVYKHNPIHTTHQNDDSLPALATNDDGGPVIDVASEKKPRKRRSKKADAQVQDEFIDGDLDMSTSPEAPKSSVKKTRKRKAAVVAHSRSQDVHQEEQKGSTARISH